MRLLSAMALFGAVCFAQEPQKPDCSVDNHAQFWPSEANTSGDARREHYQQGDLELCSYVDGKYKWKYVSVNAHTLAEAKRRKAAEKAAKAAAAADAKMKTENAAVARR
jgi:hypothetical protein